MPQHRITYHTRLPLGTCIVIMVLLYVAAISAFAQSETVLYNFQPTNDVQLSHSSLVADSAGNFYGTGIYGGIGLCKGATANCGGVFRLSPPAVTGGSWTETLIYSFGSNPNDGVGL